MFGLSTLELTRYTTFVVFIWSTRALLVGGATVSKATTHFPIVVSNWWIFFLAALIGLTLSLCLVLTICTCRSFCTTFTSCDTEVCSDDDSDSMICFSQNQHSTHHLPATLGFQNQTSDTGPISGGYHQTGQLTQVFLANSSQTPEEKQCLLTGDKGRRIIGLRTVVIES